MSYVKNGRFDTSAAAEHAIFEQHALDFDNVEVIDYERHGLNHVDLPVSSRSKEK